MASDNELMMLIKQFNKLYSEIESIFGKGILNLNAFDMGLQDIGTVVSVSGKFATITIDGDDLNTNISNVRVFDGVTVQTGDKVLIKKITRASKDWFIETTLG